MMLKILFLNEKKHPCKTLNGGKEERKRGICHTVESKSEEGKGLKVDEMVSI